MTDDDDEINSFLDAQECALAVHEAGHAVVAHALGATVVFVEADFGTLDGRSQNSNFTDHIKNLAICVAGCRAEHVFKAPALRSTKKGDFREMRKLLSHFPHSERRAARAEGYRMSDVTLKANTDGVRRIADELLARRWVHADPTVRIEGNELAVLLSAGGRA
jgi:hypothetical protein